MSSITPNSIFRQINPYESTIQQLLKVDSRKKEAFQSQKKTLNNKKTAISDIGSKLTDLNSLLSTFKDPLGHKLEPLSGQSSDSKAVSVLSTDGVKDTGSYNITVDQLAKNDAVLSGEITNSGNSLSTSGNASFDISIGSDTSASISVDTNGLSNQDAMKAVADQLNEKMGDQLQATVFNLGTGKSQLSMKSAKQGKSSQISISNVGGDATNLDLTNRFSADELNAKFTIDGVSFQRSSNKVDDAIEGLSFKLNQKTSTAQTLSVKHDTESAKKTVKSFIKKFNNVNSLIREKTFLNGKTGSHGPLEDKRSIRNLSIKLRQDASFPVSGLAGKPVQSLFDLGIDLRKDGEMYVKDSDKLDGALKNTPDAVKQLFSADGGLADRMKGTVDAAITGDGNTFDNISESIDRKITRLDDRIDGQNDFLTRQEKKYRKQYADLQQAITQGQYQFQQVQNLQSSLGY